MIVFVGKLFIIIISVLFFSMWIFLFFALNTAIKCILLKAKLCSLVNHFSRLKLNIGLREYHTWSYEACSLVESSFSLLCCLSS